MDRVYRTDFADIVIRNYLNLVGQRKVGDSDEFIMKERFVDKIDDWSFSPTGKTEDERFLTRPYIDHVKALEIMVEKKTHDATKILYEMGMASSGGCLFRISGFTLSREFDVDLDADAVRQAQEKIEHEKKKLPYRGGAPAKVDEVDDAPVYEMVEVDPRDKAGVLAEQEEPEIEYVLSKNEHDFGATIRQVVKGSECTTVREIEMDTMEQMKFSRRLKELGWLKTE